MRFQSISVYNYLSFKLSIYPLHKSMINKWMVYSTETCMQIRKPKTSLFFSRVDVGDVSVETSGMEQC